MGYFFFPDFNRFSGEPRIGRHSVAADCKSRQPFGRDHAQTQQEETGSLPTRSQAGSSVFGGSRLQTWRSGRMGWRRHPGPGLQGRRTPRRASAGKDSIPERRKFGRHSPESPVFHLTTVPVVRASGSINVGDLVEFRCSGSASPPQRHEDEVDRFAHVAGPAPASPTQVCSTRAETSPASLRPLPGRLRSSSLAGAGNAP